MQPSHTNKGFQVEDGYIIPPRLTLPSKERLPLQDIWLTSASKDLISSVDTARMFTVRSGEGQQQQDIFINALVEDIALQATLKLPVIKLTPAKPAQPDQHQAITSTAIAGIGEGLFAVLRYMMNIVMTNLVSESIYGTYIAVYTSTLIVGSIAAFGLDSTILRFLSIYQAKNEGNLAAGLVRFVVRMTIISGLIFAALLYLSAPVIAGMVYHQDAYTLPLKEIALLIPLIALQLVFGSGLQALKVIKWKILVDRLIHPTIILILTMVFYFSGLRLEALIFATLCGFLASVITGQIFLRKASKQFIDAATPRFEKKTWMHFAFPMSLNSLIQNVLNSTDVLFLTAFATAAQVGLYAVADRASTLVVMPLLALNTVFSPKIAEYHVRGEYDQLVRLSKLVTKWTFSLSLPVFLCLSLFHEAILSIFSRGYTAAGPVLIILSLGNLVIAASGLKGSLLVMTGQTRVILANTIVTIAINIGLAFLLVPRFNIIGAAIVATLVVISVNIAGTIEVYCILKIFAYRWDLLKPVIAGGVASATGLLQLHIIHVGYGYRAIIGTLGLIIPFICVYALVLTLLRFSSEDKAVFDLIRARVQRKRA